MRFNILIASTLLAANAIAAPAEKRADVDARVRVSTDNTASFQAITSALMNTIQSNLQKIQTLSSQLNGTASDTIASLKSKVHEDFLAIAAAATGLQDVVSKNLATAYANATQAEIDAVAKAIPKLTSFISQAQAAEKSAMSSMISKNATDTTDITSAYEQMMKAFSGISAAVQNYATNVQTGANTSKDQLTSNVSALVSQTIDFANAVTSSLGMGTQINARSYTNANGTVNATLVSQVINALAVAIAGGVKDEVAGTTKITLTFPSTIPGFTVQPYTFTVPGFTFNPTTISTSSKFSTSTPSLTTPRMSTPTSSLTTPKLSTTTDDRSSKSSKSLPTISSIPSLTIPSTTLRTPSSLSTPTTSSRSFSFSSTLSTPTFSRSTFTTPTSSFSTLKNPSGSFSNPPGGVTTPVTSSRSTFPIPSGTFSTPTTSLRPTTLSGTLTTPTTRPTMSMSTPTGSFTTPSTSRLTTTSLTTSRMTSTPSVKASASASATVKAGAGFST